ncbi:hypothetical protein SLEP1_g21019 [Rubroshorea leprosula]|uniref:Uncharacterized protein n=1 Tax=Rubroshorea leprosula TaxID=152421 RepID=A0AAV5J4J9_9ROSI|nr:hypothetical protein SLEP1_g21019 [Rubroshorea leprosula]
MLWRWGRHSTTRLRLFRWEQCRRDDFTLVSATTFFLLLNRGQGNYRDQEVDAATLELGVGREDEDFTAVALGAGFAENVVRIGLEDVGGRDRTGNLLDIAVEVNYSDQIESTAGKNTAQTAP